MAIYQSPVTGSIYRIRRDLHDVPNQPAVDWAQQIEQDANNKRTWPRAMYWYTHWRKKGYIPTWRLIHDKRLGSLEWIRARIMVRKNDSIYDFLAKKASRDLLSV